MGKIYRDPGHGVTETSLKFYYAMKSEIGEVRTVEGSFEPLETIPNPDYPQASLEYNLRITGHLGAILLSGCNSGYSGEGPNGTRQILVELGMDRERARRTMTMPHFKWYMATDRVEGVH